jgi:hypothetical protein
MLATLFGLGITGVSGAVIVKSMKTSSKINDDKNKFLNSAVPFSKFNEIPEGKNILTKVNVDDKLTAGVLEILRRQTKLSTKTVIDTNFRISAVKIYEIPYWEKYVQKRVNLNLGFDNFVPPDDLKKIIFEDNDVSSRTANTFTTFEKDLKRDFGVTLGLPSNGTYVANFSSYSGKPVFAYGMKSGNTFHAELMASNSKTITKSVFYDEDFSNNLTLAGGVIGGVTGIALILAGFGDISK